jgi:hypothetical protein
LKKEGKDRYGDQYKKWQEAAAEFMIDNQAPVRCKTSAVASAFWFHWSAIEM